MKKIFGLPNNPSETRTFTTGSGIEVKTNGKVVWLKVGAMTIYAEANCPTRDDKVEEFISIHGPDSEKTRTYNDFYGKVLTQQEEEWLETHGAIHPREIAGYDDIEPGEYQ